MDDAFAGQVMTEPVLTIETDTPIGEAAEAMLASDIKSVVAIDADCRPEGILTSTDFVRLTAERGDPDAATVADHMTTDIVTTAADAAVPDVAETMLAEGISHVPVVDEDEQVMGILTSTDMASYVSGFDAARPARDLP